MKHMKQFMPEKIEPSKKFEDFNFDESEKKEIDRLVSMANMEGIGFSVSVLSMLIIVFGLLISDVSAISHNLNALSPVIVNFLVFGAMGVYGHKARNAITNEMPQSFLGKLKTFLGPAADPDAYLFRLLKKNHFFALNHHH